MTTAAPLPEARGPGRAVLTAVLVGTATTLVVLALTATRTAGEATGLPTAGAAVGATAAAARALSRVASVVTVGSLLVPSWVLAPHLLDPRTSRRVRTVARVAASGWVLASVVGMLAASAEALAVPWDRALLDARTWAFVPSLAGGRALMVTAVLAALVASGTAVARSATDHLVLLGVALAALVPTALTGHAAAADLHVAVSVTTAAHVAGAALWVGGLVGLALVGRHPGLVPAVGRFSGLALVAALAVTASGVLSAWWRLGTDGPAWTSTYGALVVAKTVALAGLLALGALHRRRTIPALASGRARAWWRLVVVETVLMGAVLGLAVALGRTTTPTRAGVVALPHGGVTTVDRRLPAPSPARLLLETRPDALALGLLAVAAVLLALLATRPGAPASRTRGVAFGLAALVVLGWLLVGGPGAYGSAVLAVQAARLVAAAVLVAPLVVGALRQLAPTALPRPRGGFVDAVLPFALLCVLVEGTPLLRLSLADGAVQTCVVLVAVAAGVPVALRSGGGHRRALALLVGVSAVLLWAVVGHPDAFAPEWFRDLPLDWADPVRGTGIDTRV